MCRNKTSPEKIDLKIFERILLAAFLIRCSSEPPIIVIRNDAVGYAKLRGISDVENKIKSKLEERGYEVEVREGELNFRVLTEVKSKSVNSKLEKLLSEVLGKFEKTEKGRKDTFEVNLGINSLKNLTEKKFVRKALVLNGTRKEGLAHRVMWSLISRLGLACLEPQNADYDTFSTTIIYHNPKERELVKSIKEELKIKKSCEIPELVDIVIITGVDALSK